MYIPIQCVCVCVCVCIKRVKLCRGRIHIDTYRLSVSSGYSLIIADTELLKGMFHLFLVFCLCRRRLGKF